MSLFGNDARQFRLQVLCLYAEGHVAHDVVHDVAGRITHIIAGHVTWFAAEQAAGRESWTAVASAIRDRNVCMVINLPLSLVISVAKNIAGDEAKRLARDVVQKKVPQSKSLMSLVRQ